MARTKKNNVDYFPHYVSHGKKMFCLRAKYKNDGYAVWFMLLEKLGNAENHYLDLSSETEKIYLSSELMVSEEVLFDIINMLVTLEVFDSELWHKENILYNQEFVNNIQDVYNRRTGRECINRESLINILSSMGRNKCSSKAILKPSKAVKPIKDNSVRLEQFDKFFEAYNKNVGKDNCLKKFLSLSNKEVEKILETIEDYVLANDVKKFRKAPLVYLNQKVWKDEIILKENTTNTMATFDKVVDLFNETEFPATIKKYTTSKEKIKVRLYEFLEKNCNTTDFKRKTNEGALKWFISSLEFSKPKKVVDYEAIRLEDEEWGKNFNT